MIQSISCSNHCWLLLGDDGKVLNYAWAGTHGPTNECGSHFLKMNGEVDNRSWKATLRTIMHTLSWSLITMERKDIGSLVVKVDVKKWGKIVA